jgi:hypothetical protein
MVSCNLKLACQVLRSSDSSFSLIATRSSISYNLLLHYFIFLILPWAISLCHEHPPPFSSTLPHQYHTRWLNKVSTLQSKSPGLNYSFFLLSYQKMWIQNRVTNENLISMFRIYVSPVLIKKAMKNFNNLFSHWHYENPEDISLPYM